MFRHVLIGVDGSPLSLKAARYALELARSVSALASAVIVTPTWGAIAPAEIAQDHFGEDYAMRMSRSAERCLDKVRAIAMERRIVCEMTHVSAARAREAIASTAVEHGCDLIVVAAHGKRGTERTLLGSDTARLLTHSKVPVLVYRE